MQDPIFTIKNRKYTFIGDDLLLAKIHKNVSKLKKEIYENGWTAEDEEDDDFYILTVLDPKNPFNIIKDANTVRKLFYKAVEKDKKNKLNGKTGTKYVFPIFKINLTFYQEKIQLLYFNNSTGVLSPQLFFDKEAYLKLVHLHVYEELINDMTISGGYKEDWMNWIKINYKNIYKEMINIEKEYPINPLINY